MLIRPEPQMPWGLVRLTGDDHWVQGHGFDMKIFNSTAGSPHAVLDAAAFKGRTGRTGSADHPLLIADNDLAVGTDINEERQFRAFMHLAGMHPGGDVTAHITRNRGVQK